MKVPVNVFLVLILLTLCRSSLIAQDGVTEKKHAFTFSLTSCLVNEINAGVEFPLGPGKILELNGGLIFVNDFLEDQTSDWKNSQAFSEHGFTARAHLKVMSSTEKTNKKWRNYIAPGLVFKSLYYNEQWFTNVLSDSKDRKYFERLYQSRDRMKVGIEFLWGKVYTLNKTFSFDFFYGGGVMGTKATRNVLKTIEDSRTNEIDESSKVITSYYLRPLITTGFKICIRF